MATWALVLCGALIVSCGMASRVRFASLDLQALAQEPDPEALAALRGAEPTLWQMWSFSASLAARSSGQDLEPALELLDRSRTFLPGNPNLETAWVDLVGLTRSPEDQLAAIDLMLGELPISPVEAWLRAARVRVLLELGRVDEAEQEAVRQGGVIDSDPFALSDSLARVALAFEAMGKPQQADHCFDLSLARGPAGVSTLALESARRPERGAAARSLRRRAVNRHPRDPDLALAQVDDALVQADPARAEELLENMPAPVPERMRSQVIGLSAHLALVAGRVDEALGIVRSRLRDVPTDPTALMVLWDLWTQHHRPDREVVIALYDRALRQTRDRQLAERLQSALQVLADESSALPVVEEQPAP